MGPARRDRTDRREAIPRPVFATFTNVFAWMGLGTVAMRYVTVSDGALLADTMPPLGYREWAAMALTLGGMTLGLQRR